MHLSSTLRDNVGNAGFAIVEAVLSQSEIEVLRREADRLMGGSPERAGCRNALRRSEAFRDVAVSPGVLRLARAVLGPRASVRKLTLFDKTPESNWGVPWHQDLTITVRAKCPMEGFGPWSLKDGTVHVQPPSQVLEEVVAIRLHLDSTNEATGALRVLPGTHRSGKLTREKIHRMAESVHAADCRVPAGGAMLMRPLLVHSSKSAPCPTNRRVLHFEYSAAELPAGLEWA